MKPAKPRQKPAAPSPGSPTPAPRVKAPPAKPSARDEASPEEVKKPRAGMKAWDLRRKLEALAARGINGEMATAKHKLARLLDRMDFSKPVLDTPDLFKGVFVRANVAAPIMPFTPTDWDVGNAVKHAFEKETGIQCCWRADSLMAEASPTTASRMNSIGETVATNFRELWRQFSAAPGVNPADRANFVMGLGDGMLDEVRTGTALPARARPAKPARKAKVKAVALPAGISLHPYSVATALGKQIRFEVPLATIAGELAAVIKGELTA